MLRLKEYRGLWEPRGGHLAHAGVSGKSCRDPVHELGLGQKKKRKGIPEGEGPRAKAQSCERPAGSRGLREGSRTEREKARSEGDSRQAPLLNFTLKAHL